eukprot:gene15948-15756_t
MTVRAQRRIPLLDGQGRVERAVEVREEVAAARGFPLQARAERLGLEADDEDVGQAGEVFAGRLHGLGPGREVDVAVGEVDGEGPDAIVARMETRITNGDFVAAAAEWDKLPEPAKKASQTYKTSLDARIRVEQLVGSTLKKAVSATKTD